MRPDVRQRQLILAALAAGAAGLALVALGWWIVDWQVQTSWARLSDLSWWTGEVMRLLGLAAFSGVGFKVALAAVVGVGAGIGWLRIRRHRQAEVGQDAKSEPAPDETSPQA